LIALNLEVTVNKNIHYATDAILKAMPYEQQATTRVPFQLVNIQLWVNKRQSFLRCIVLDTGSEFNAFTL